MGIAAHYSIKGYLASKRASVHSLVVRACMPALPKTKEEPKPPCEKLDAIHRITGMLARERANQTISGCAEARCCRRDGTNRQSRDTRLCEADLYTRDISFATVSQTR